MRTIFIVISLTVTSFMGIPDTLADDVNGAAKAFSQAQEATLSGDIARAADLSSSRTSWRRLRPRCATRPVRGSRPAT
ncbi:MAG TPA: hypothetical protein VK601_28615 [Kofleriaceae bacterium]|nr:hypothetical protein [Kofleriaceae bacterium]